MAYIVDGAARMKQLIEDLLAYSRVGTRGREFRPVACEEALDKALINLRAAIEAGGATVTHDPLPVLEADDSQLAQLFQNLIGNALKFHGAEAPRVHVGAAEHETEWEFLVRDNGIGIEPQYFERIFMVFQRLHNKSEYPGTGIGLAICKKVVDRHGGRIWVESKPGEGSTMHFTLPKERGKNMTDSTRASPVEILLVEDNPGDVRLTKEALKEGKVYSNLHWAKDGVEALEFLRRQGKFADVPRPDIILLDLNLPKKDGREVLSEIKNDDDLKRIPVVILTTSKAEEDVLRSYKLHANCYVTKPVDLEKFIVVVQSIDKFWLTVVTLPNGK